MLCTVYILNTFDLYMYMNKVREETNILGTTREDLVRNMQYEFK